MMNQPTNFSYMDPQGAIELDRAAYGDPHAKQRVQSWLSSSADSSSIICFDEVSAQALMYTTSYQHTDNHF